MNYVREYWRKIESGEIITSRRVKAVYGRLVREMLRRALVICYEEIEGEGREERRLSIFPPNKKECLSKTTVSRRPLAGRPQLPRRHYRRAPRDTRPKSLRGHETIDLEPSSTAGYHDYHERHGTGVGFR